MFVPDSFRQTDQNKLYDFIEGNSFGALVSQHRGPMEATHLPLILDRESEPSGQLIGHMARANPQWHDSEGQPVLVIFGGPHAYVSPTWYQDRNVVPTWNYVAVHVTGTIRLIQDEAGMLDVLHRYVDFYESTQSPSWTIETEDPEFIRRLAGATVAFRIEIDNIDGKWKLSQNHSRERRQRVIDALSAQQNAAAAELAAYMNETLIDSPGDR